VFGIAYRLGLRLKAKSRMRKLLARLASRSLKRIEKEDFSLTELLAIGRSLNELILADGKVSTEEIEYITKLADIACLSIDHLKDSKDLSLDNAIEILNEMSMRKKEIAGIIFSKMVFADNNLDEKELKIVSSIFLAVGIVDE
jgi:uncharacterized tellurite resistance protein B-like protein